MSVDTERVKELMSYIHTIWSAPLQVILSLIFLYLTMGPSIFAGFAIMVLMIPLNFSLVWCSKMVKVNQMVHKNSRIKLISEVLNGIKVYVHMTGVYLESRP